MIYRIFKKSYFDNSFKKSGKIESGQKKSGKIESEQKKSGKIESGYKKSGKIESEQKKSGKIERVSEQSAVVGKYLSSYLIGLREGWAPKILITYTNCRYVWFLIINYRTAVVKNKTIHMYLFFNRKYYIYYNSNIYPFMEFF